MNIIKKNYLLFILGIFFFTSYGCKSTNSNVEELHKNITIVYNNDVFGYLEPCGCRVDPIGGMNRRWNYTQQIPKSEKVSLDSGNLFFITNKPADYMKAQLLEQAHTLVEAYNLLDWDVYSPGENDFAFGVGEFKKLENAAKFKFISSNLFYKKTNNKLLQENIILERQGKKIGVFAIYSPELNIPEELEVRNPLEISREQIEKLKRNGAEFIVLLSSQGLEADQKLAESIRGIDLIVGGYTQSYLQKPIQVQDTTIVQLSSKNQVFGYLKYGVNKNSWKILDSQVLELDSKYETNTSNLKNPMKGLVAVMNMKINEINKNQSVEIWNKNQAERIEYSTYKSCESCHYVQKEFQQKHPHSAAFLTLVQHQKENNLDCIRCHSVGFAQPGGFVSLSEALQTKYGDKIDYQLVLKHAGLSAIRGQNFSYRSDNQRRSADVKKWESSLEKNMVKKNFLGVQCENCHGLKPNHPFTDFTSTVKVKAISCLQCHTVDQAPAWYDSKNKPILSIINKKIRSVSCPKSS